MDDPLEPEPQKPHPLSIVEQVRLIRSLRKLGLRPLRLPGLTDLRPWRPCHGYQFGCMCGACSPRRRARRNLIPIRQPWEPRSPRSRSDKP